MGEAGTLCRRRIDAVEPKFSEIKRINEGVDCANRVLLVDPLVKTLRQERRLPTICPFDAPLYEHP